MVNLAEVAGAWRSLFQRVEAPPAPRRAPLRQEPVPPIPFEPRSVARIRLVRRAVAVPAQEA